MEKTIKEIKEKMLKLLNECGVIDICVYVTEECSNGKEKKNVELDIKI